MSSETLSIFRSTILNHLLLSKPRYLVRTGWDIRRAFLSCPLICSPNKYVGRPDEIDLVTHWYFVSEGRQCKESKFMVYSHILWRQLLIKPGKRWRKTKAGDHSGPQPLRSSCQEISEDWGKR